MTREEEIIKALSRSTFRYKGMTVGMFGFPVQSRKSLYAELSKLRKKKYIIKEGKYWKILPDGTRYLETRRAKLKLFDSPFSKESPKNLLVMFDVSESRKAEREWLRHHLRKFGYIMVQKSVWVGPSPLPKGFTDYLKNIKLSDSLKTFKLARGYKI